MPLTGSQSAFLILSNPRSGSTWLETSLGGLDDVAVNYELKWKGATNYVPQGIHRLVDNEGADCLSALADIAADKPVVGSKFLLDGRPFPLEQMDDLLAAFDPSIRILHLTRGYFDILLSARGHGAVHVFNKKAVKDGSADIVKVLDRESDGKRGSVDQKASTRIFDDALCFRFARLKHRFFGGASVTFMAYDSIVGLLLSFFLNDLVLLQIAKQAKQSRRIDYADIASAFPALAAFVGSSVDEAGAKAIMDNPVTRKMGDLKPELFSNHKALQRIAAILDQARDEAAASLSDIADYWQAVDGGKGAVIRVPGLRAAVDAGRKSILPRARANDNEPLTWVFA